MSLCQYLWYVSHLRAMVGSDSVPRSISANQWSANRPSRTVMAASGLRPTLAPPGPYKGREDTPASRPRQPP